MTVCAIVVVSMMIMRMMRRRRKEDGGCGGGWVLTIPQNVTYVMSGVCWGFFNLRKCVSLYRQVLPIPLSGRILLIFAFLSFLNGVQG